LASDRIDSDYQQLSGFPLVYQLLDSFPDPVRILNWQRQIDQVNKRTTDFFGVPIESLLRRHPGEVLGCVHAWENCADCGTAEFCENCGAGQALADCQTSGLPQVKVCVLGCKTENGSTKTKRVRVYTPERK
jgi:hypothetical protein